MVATNSHTQTLTNLSNITSSRYPGHIVIVLGMHRSGTSLCTNVLKYLGVALSDDLLGPAPDNKKGFFESSKIVEIHKQIMTQIGTGAADSISINPRPPSWWTMQELAWAKSALCKIVLTESANKSRLWGFKDPRTVVLLPIWRDVLSEAGVKPIYLLTLRRPGEVAASLKKRNGIAESLSELLWIEHYLEAIRHVGKDIALIMPYDRWFCAPLDQIRAIAAAIGYIPGSDTDTDAAFVDIVKEAFHPDMRHHIDTNDTFIFDITRILYNWLSRGDLTDSANMVLKVEAELPHVASQVNAQQRAS